MESRVCEQCSGGIKTPSPPRLFIPSAMSRRVVPRNPLFGLDLNIQVQKRQKRNPVKKPNKAQPFTTVPPEIITEIFVHCLSSNPDDRPRLYCAPLLLLRVCGSWREIALAAPRLWTRLAIFPPRWFFSKPGEVEQYVDTWFQRAKALPVSLDFTGYDVQDKNSIHAILSAHAPRLQSLTLSLPIVDFFTDTLEFPQLQQITLAVLFERPGGVGRYIEAHSPCESFKTAPQLREIPLRRPAAPGLFLLPLERLAKFTGEGLTVNQCLDFLRSVPSLVECSVTVEKGDAGRLLGDERVLMQHLRSLHLGADEDAERSEVVKILEVLEVPALEHLDLDCIPHLQSFDREMAAFFSRVSASLQSLSLTSDAVTYLEPSTLEWFIQLPNLTHVEFVNPKNDFMSSFFCKLHEMDFLSRLHTLRFLQCSFPVDAELVDVLVARFIIGLFEVFELLSSDSSDEGLDPQLQKLVDNGMQIRISH
ncbi:hypothetical protein FB45DRAFT_427637 [Roridomyces roridus]|uniref:F-box domain-containing protein n=1 Tax=Roridomyces roridus TaxID=1738132 RepID=A0AAD7C5Y6_9AGAR|nr:hypothetical protein FB45DRAFT_427637 [Roridomyces roridus]